MNRSVRFACAALFVGTTICSLVMSASATVQKADSVHIPGAVTWSAVGVLELLSLAGTLRWLTASTPRGRTHAIVVVAAVAAVTGQAGWSFYGWWGALAPMAVVGTVHMVAETLRDVGPVQEESERSHAVTPAGPAPAATPEPIAPAIPEPSPGPFTEPFTAPTETLSEPDPEPDPMPDDEAARVADLRAHAAELGRMPGRDAVKVRYGVGSSTANRLRDKAAKPALTLASGGS